MVIKDIVITEKALQLAQKGQYTFLVNAQANKEEVAQAVAKQFNVHPISVNIAILPRKSIRRGKAEGHKSLRKKAFVMLKKGEKIAAFELPVEKEEKKGAAKPVAKPIQKEEKKGAEVKVVKREVGRVKV